MKKFPKFIPDILSGKPMKTMRVKMTPPRAKRAWMSLTFP
jgi:hypothetical protein